MTAHRTNGATPHASDLTVAVLALNAAPDQAGKLAAVRAGAAAISEFSDEHAAQAAIDHLHDLAVDANDLDPDETTAAIGEGLALGKQLKAENIDSDRKAAELDGKPASSKLKPFDVAEFLALKIPPREMLLAPILPEKGLTMVYAPRGVGKTHVAHGIGFAVATGGLFLRWAAPKPRRVLVVDGEMPGSELQKRLGEIIAGAAIKPAPGAFNLLPADLVEGGVGNLADPKVQAALDPWLDGIELLILDNLSTLTSVLRDNDQESWGPIQEWLLRLRRRGISALLVHHAGKGGTQRGTSRREDVLDTSISLRRPSDYVATEGARFEIHIEKGRGIHGADAKPFEAKLEVRNGACLWTMRDIEDVAAARVAALLEDGLSLRDIELETGIKKSTVHNIKQKLNAEKKGQAHGT
jgi:putative DNA primase/helicase